MEVDKLSTNRADEIQDSVPRLLRLALALTGHRATAEDLVQETVARVWDRAGDVRGPLHPYLRRVLVNLHHDATRRDRTKIAWLEGLRRAEPTVEQPDSAARIDAERLLANLTPKFRELVVLRYYADLTFDQIADLTSQPAGTVRRQCVEALTQLRTHSHETDEQSADTEEIGK